MDGLAPVWRYMTPTVLFLDFMASINIETEWAHFNIQLHT